MNLTFLRANAQTKHDFNVNSVDIADQHRGHYRFDKWCRNNKWWMALFHWNYGDVNLNSFHIYQGANIDVWLVCSEKDKAKHLYDHYELKKGSFMAMIDPEGRYHDVHKHGTIKGQTVAPATVTPTKRSTEEAGMTAADFVTYIRTSTKSTRCTDATLNPNHGILNVRLVNDINHLPKDDTRSEMSGRCCALCRWATGKQLRARLLCCFVCNVHLCVSCYHLFHDMGDAKVLKKEVEKRCQSNK